MTSVIQSPSARVRTAFGVIAVDSLSQTIAFLAGQLDIAPTPSRLDQLFQELSHYEEDFADVRSQEMAERAVTIAAAGGHNLLTLWSITPLGFFSRLGLFWPATSK